MIWDVNVDVTPLSKTITVSTTLCGGRHNTPPQACIYDPDMLSGSYRSDSDTMYWRAREAAEDLREILTAYFADGVRYVSVRIYVTGLTPALIEVLDALRTANLADLDYRDIMISLMYYDKETDSYSLRCIDGLVL